MNLKRAKSLKYTSEQTCPESRKEELRKSQQQKLRVSNEENGSKSWSSRENRAEE